MQPARRLASRTIARACVAPAAAVIAMSLATEPVLARESASTQPAQSLAALLQQRQLDAAAAADPDQPGRFIAALNLPGSELLVIVAQYPAPGLIEALIGQQQYRQAYIELHASGARSGRVFVTDLQADGLRPTRAEREPFDIVYRDGTDTASYNGDWDEQKLTRSEYEARFKKDDLEYARILKVLIGSLTSSEGSR